MKNPTVCLICHLLMLTVLAEGQPVPSISGFSPTSGSTESSVIITGANFSTIPGENIVYFGPVKAVVSFASATQLDVIVPVGATSHPITVTVRGLTAYSGSSFRVTFPFNGTIGGSFENRTDFWVGYQIKWEVVSDIDGDGKSDIIFGDEGSGSVGILRNASSPGTISWDSFESGIYIPAGMAPYGLAAGDLDGDGKPDLVVTNSQSSSVLVMRNTSTPGAISFETHVEFTTSPGPAFIAIRDLDLDGRPDVAVACNNGFGEGFISVLRNTSTPGSINWDSFAPRIDLAAGNGGVWFVGLEDLDGDGRPDMIASNGGDARVSIFKNISTSGSLTPESFGPKVELETGAYPAIIAIADLDGDQKPDLAVGNAAGNSISIFKNSTTPGILHSSSFERTADISCSGPWNPTTGDVDGDGKLDLIARQSSRGLLSVFKNKSSEGILTEDSFSPPYALVTEGNSLGISVADLDGDGKSDIVLSNEVTNVISVYRNEDLFKLSPPTSLAFSNITHTSLSASFVASPDEPDGYIAIRRIGAFPDPPQNGVTYSAGQQIGEDVVAFVGPGTSFEESSLTSGVEYFYKCYAYYGEQTDIQYITSEWAANIAFTIGFDLGPIVSVSPESFSLDDEITIIFDATKSYPLNALVGASNIYMYSGVISEGPESGNWNLNHVNYSDLRPLGDNKWTISFIPRYFYGYVPASLTVYKLAMVFYDQEMHRGVSFDGRDIYLTVSPTILTPPMVLPATFVSSSGFEAEWNAAYDISEYYLDVSASETFETFVTGYENKVVYGWGTIRATVAGLQPDMQYYYRVRAVGIPESSSIISVTTAPAPTTGSKNNWVKSHGGPGNEEIQTLTSDDKGNIYAAGHFTGTVSFGSITLHSKGDFDVFFVKYDPDGNVIWARSIGGPALDNEVSLATDSKELYMTAQFQGETDVDPGPGTTPFFNEGQWWVNDLFFAKYSLKDGSLIWAHKIVDAYGWSSSAIGVDRSGVYLTGEFYGSSDFDPAETETFLNSQGESDIFLAKYSLQGNLIWAQGLGSYYPDAAWGLMTDETGLYIHGYYNWQCDFDPTENYYYLENYGGFFGRYDLATGNLIYVMNAGNGRIFSLDKHGNDLYICGEIYGSVDADPGEGVYSIGRDGFAAGLVAKYDVLEGNFQWGRDILTTAFIGPRKIIADQSGVYVSGYFAGSADFSSGPEEANRTSARIDAFVARYKADGGLSWVKGIAAPGYAVSIAATLTDDGYYLGGLFGDTVNFDPYDGESMRTAVGTEDIFIARYSRDGKAKKDQKKNESAHYPSGEDERTIHLFPNPVKEILNINCRGFDMYKPVEVTILDLAGHTMMAMTISGEDTAIDITRLPEGLYFLRVSQGYSQFTERFAKE